MKSRNVAVIGGGASGMVAAITAASHGADVTIYERNDRLGKKILATGNGKCNLGNKILSADQYQSDHEELVGYCLERFGVEDTIRFFESLGLMIRDKGGYLYPYSEQASSVLDVLRMTIERSGIKVLYGAKVDRLERRGNGSFAVSYEGGKQGIYDRVILACGSKAAPKTGSDGKGYQLARQVGLTVTEIFPALVQLKCKEEFCKAIAGVRTEAVVHIETDGKELLCESGEVQFTDYGISGIPVFQLSGSVNRLLSEKKYPEARIDFFPDTKEKEWKELCRKRISLIGEDPTVTIEGFFTGMLNKKLMTVMVKNAGLKTNDLISEASMRKIQNVFEQCRAFRLHITGSNSYDNAQVCTGGVSMRQLTEELEATKVPGLYLAGEVLDVDGRCGGYNLQWAWTSGYLTGKAAAGSAGGRKDKK